MDELTRTGTQRALGLPDVPADDGLAVNEAGSWATFSFHGTNVADSTQSLSLEAHFNVTTNANGQVTVNLLSVNCH